MMLLGPSIPVFTLHTGTMYIRRLPTAKQAIDIRCTTFLNEIFH